MAILACITLSLLVPVPQEGEDPRLKTTLSKSEIKSLNTKAKKWIDAELKWDSDPKYRRKRDKAKRSFMAELEKRNKKEKGDDKGTAVLQSVGNLLGIFEHVFPYGRQSTNSGNIKSLKGYYLRGPQGYRPTSTYASVVVLRGWDKKKKAWADPRAYLNAAWGKAELIVKDTFLVLPELVKGDDYDTPPKLTTELGQQNEQGRIRGVLGVFGEVQRAFRLDRSRRFLDCGPGTCGYGLRLVTYFPSLFAGIILRHPVDQGAKVKLNSLRGLKVLMVSTDESAQACNKLQKILDDLQPGNVTIVKGEGDAPYAGATAEIEAWVRQHSRPLFPKEVVIAPNFDKFRKAFWVDMITCDPLEFATVRPMLHAKADPENNRIVITSKSVSEIGLFMNDAIVDLGNEVSIVINGKEIKHKFQRSVLTVEKYMRKQFDATALYTAYYRFEVPKEEKPEKGEKTEKDEPGEDEKTAKPGKDEETGKTAKGEGAK